MGTFFIGFNSVVDDDALERGVVIALEAEVQVSALLGESLSSLCLYFLVWKTKVSNSYPGSDSSKGQIW